MTVPARKLAIAAGPLRVAVAAPSLAARRWTRLLEELGHAVVDLKDADVVLAETDYDGGGDLPTVRIGDTNLEAQGRLLQDATEEQIDAALRAAASGLIVSAPELGERGLRPLGDLQERSLLTPRELEVLKALSDGLTNKAIARRFDISLHTVKFHLESVFRKLGVRTRSEATARWLKRVSKDTITF
jgi:DNA-binding CsgD family transcriptional regulator